MQQVETGILLEECRELVTNRMRSSMSRMMGHVEDVLFEMATVDSCTAEARQYIDAVREIRMKKREIQVRFENRFINLFRESVSRLNSADAGCVPSGGEVEVLESPVFKDRADFATIRKTLNKARRECRTALSVLDDHVYALFVNEGIGSFVNPLQPGTVFTAFWDSCSDIRTGADIRSVLVEMFDRYVVSDLHNVYDDLNTLFGFYEANRQSIRQDFPYEEINSTGEPAIDNEVLSARYSLLVRYWTRSRIEEYIGGRGIPAFILHFLQESWVMVLQDVYEKHGESGPDWDRAMQVVDDLINCTQQSPDRETRTQQIWMLPGLIYRLKSGMKGVSVPLKIQADFLSELKSHHTRITELSFEKTNV